MPIYCCDLVDSRPSNCSLNPLRGPLPMVGCTFHGKPRDRVGARLHWVAHCAYVCVLCLCVRGRDHASHFGVVYVWSCGRLTSNTSQDGARVAEETPKVVASRPQLRLMEAVGCGQPERVQFYMAHRGEKEEELEWFLCGEGQKKLCSEHACWYAQENGCIFL